MLVWLISKWIKKHLQSVSIFAPSFLEAQLANYCSQIKNFLHDCASYYYYKGIKI